MSAPRDILAKQLVSVAHKYRKRRSYAQALIFFRMAQHVSPGLADVLAHIALCLEDLGERAESLVWYRKAAHGRAARGSDLLCAAHGLRRNQEHELATQVFARAVALASDNVDVLIEAATDCKTRHCFADAAKLLEQAQALRPHDAAIARKLASLRAVVGKAVHQLDCMIVGTTGTCNASCIHCPTGKASTAHVPRIPMDMKLFRHLIDQLATGEVEVTGHISFGLFGDGLADPFVVERAAYVRKVLPDVRLEINTNGAAYDPKKHAALKDTVTRITLHCESLIPEVYDRLMAPLRLERVKAKHAALCRDFPGQLGLSIPISRANHDEMNAIFRHFKALGAAQIAFYPLSARCSRDQTLFDSLSFAPQAIACTPDVMNALLIDCDGTAVSCCNDFEREVPVGTFRDGSLIDLLNDPKRQAMIKALAEKRHSEISTCARCRADVVLPGNAELVLEPAE